MFVKRAGLDVVYWLASFWTHCDAPWELNTTAASLATFNLKQPSSWLYTTWESTTCVTCRQFFESLSSLSQVSLCLITHFGALKSLILFLAHDYPH